MATKKKPDLGWPRNYANGDQVLVLFGFTDPQWTAGTVRRVGPRSVTVDVARDGVLDVEVHTRAKIRRPPPLPMGCGPLPQKLRCGNCGSEGCPMCEP